MKEQWITVGFWLNWTLRCDCLNISLHIWSTSSYEWPLNEMSSTRYHCLILLLCYHCSLIFPKIWVKDDILYVQLCDNCGVFQQHLTWILVFCAVEAQAKFSCKVYKRDQHLWDLPWNVGFASKAGWILQSCWCSLEIQRNSEVKEAISWKIQISVI